MLNRFVIIALLILAPQVRAQKVMEKVWDATTIDSIVVVSDEISQIKIETHPGDSILLDTRVEGEHYESVLLQTKRKDGQLLIGTGFKPYHDPPNDKLAAHKILAITMSLKVPEDRYVAVQSVSAMVRGSGRFSYLDLTLEDSDCLFYDFTGDGSIKTVSGAIEIHTIGDVGGTARSQSGNVLNKLPESGIYFITAESKYGDVKLVDD